MLDGRNVQPGRELSRLRLENVALGAKVRELEDALAFCRRRYGVPIREVLEYVVDDYDPADYARAFDGDGDGNGHRDGPSVAAVADAARRLHRAGMTAPAHVSGDDRL